MIDAQMKVIHDPIKNLELLKTAVQKRVLRKSIRAGLNPMTKELKQAIPKRTGAGKLSIGKKISTSKRGIVSGIAGPRSSFTKTVNGKVLRPSKYLPILEKKRKAGRFILPVFIGGQRRYVETARAKAEEEIAVELAKLPH